MAKLESWLSAIRPRTLFLALATPLCGSAIALSTGIFNIAVFIFTILTAMSLQILSNMANDLGDYQHGTDITGNRIGPKRTIQSGAITPTQMKKAILVTIIISCILGIILVFIAAQFIDIKTIIILLLLGAAAIIAAIKYTAGKNPYGYIGLGDLFSFIFFGLMAVVGTYFLHTHKIDFRPWLPAIGLGLLTIAVLNVNNMRDMQNDKQSGKLTIPIMLGFGKAKLYHAFLTFGSMGCFITYSMLYTNKWYQYLYLLVFILLIKLLLDICRINENKRLDPYLKYTSMCTCLLSICFSICINLP